MVVRRQVPITVCLFLGLCLICMSTSMVVALGSHAAAARRAPAGSSPVSTERHSATGNLRASATTMILRMRPLAPPVRSMNQQLSALSG
jgi:hypothetical protein